ncbi:hypothetical protein ACF0H5_013991 [Mactra antiquata]
MMGEPKAGAPPLGSIGIEELWSMIKERDRLILMQSQKIETLEETVKQLRNENAELKKLQNPHRTGPFVV